MDNLTHTLTGLMMSRAGLEKYTPRASLLLMLAANAPDVDILTILNGNPSTYLHYHRGITHSIALAPVVALIPLAVVAIVQRKGIPWGKAYLLSLLGVASHLLLDWTNIYGIRLLKPFSERWLRLDTTSVIDLWIWSVLLLALLWPVLSKLVSSEIGARSRAGRGIARFALAFLLLYDGTRFVLHQRVIDLLESRLHAGETPVRVAALPYMANPLHWTGLVQIRNGYVMHEVDLTREFDPTLGKVYYQAESSPAIETARRTPAFQTFLDFSQFPLWRITPVSDPEGATEVEAIDMRFGAPGEGRFTASCILDASGSVLKSEFYFEKPGVSVRLR